MKFARACAFISTALHVATLLLTIRAMMPAPEPPAEPKPARRVPCHQETVFNSYDTNNN